MRRKFALVLALCLAPSVARAQDFKAEPLKEGPPSALAAPIRAALEGQGYRVLGADGKPFADIWLRKATPATGKPAGPNGAILNPVLTDGELIGALRFAVEGHDFRDQAIPPGVYTLRYGLHPVNGDHQGVSDYRDFALLIPAAKDTEVANLARKALETKSAEASGTSHPAVLLLSEVPADATPGQAVHDDLKNTWGILLPLGLKVQGDDSGARLPLLLVVSGMSMQS